MQAALLGVDDITDELERQWRDLASRALEPNPFFEPDLLVPAVRHLSPPAEFRLLVVGQPGRYHLLMPVWRGRHWRRVPSRAAHVWTPLGISLGTPLMDREGATALGVAWTLLRRWAGHVVLDKLPTDGPVGAALGDMAARRKLAVVEDHSFERGILRQPEPGEHVLAVSGKHRREMDRMTRRLEDALDGALCVTDEADDDDTVEALLRFEAQGWRGAAGVAALDTSGAAFVRESVARLRRQGRLQLPTLRFGGKMVAALLCVTAGDTTYWLRIAHDVAYEQFSPGVTLMIAVSESIVDLEPGSVFDSCADRGHRTINRLWRDRRTLTTTVVPTGRLGSRATLAASRVVSQAKPKRVV